jgi:hypothetical protein
MDAGPDTHGSDGCIVPLHHADFEQLMKALEHSQGGVLFVQEAMDGGRFV